MINELQAVDTTGIEPMAHAQDVMLPLREDVVTASGPARAVPERGAGRARTASTSCRRVIE